MSGLFSNRAAISHSHADQNSFQLNAYGEPLLIDSGYYPWYGSPHHTLWARQTRAHNAVLVNGRGQGNFSMEASGRIESFRHTGKLTLVRAEAGAAYKNIEDVIEATVQAGISRRIARFIPVGNVKG